MVDIKNKGMIKKDVVVLIKEIHKRFMVFDFVLYTEMPKDLNKFFTNKKTKEKYKRLTFEYKNKVKIVYNLTEYEHKVWRANFPMNNLGGVKSGK